MTKRMVWDAETEQGEYRWVEITPAHIATDDEAEATERHAATITLDAARAARIDSGDIWDTAEAEATIARIDAACIARRDAEWTVETTQARREGWNARVRAGEFTGASGKVDGRKVQDAEAQQGWYGKDLKAAITRLGL
jgi:hypothetical protein